MCSGWLLGSSGLLLGAHSVLSQSDESVETDDLLKERKSLEGFFGASSPSVLASVPAC